MKKGKSFLAFALTFAMLLSLAMPTALAGAVDDKGVNDGYGMRILGDGAKGTPNTAIPGVTIGTDVKTVDGAQVPVLTVAVQAKVPAGSKGAQLIWFMLKYDNTKLTLLNKNNQAITPVEELKKNTSIAKTGFVNVATEDSTATYNTFTSSIVKDGSDGYCFFGTSAGGGAEPADQTADFVNMGYLTFKLTGAPTTNAAAVKTWAAANLDQNSLRFADPDRSPKELNALKVLATEGSTSTIQSYIDPTTGNNPAHCGIWKETLSPGINAANVYADYPGSDRVAPYTVKRVELSLANSQIEVPVAGSPDKTQQVKAVIIDNQDVPHHTLPTGVTWSITGFEGAELSPEQKNKISIDQNGLITVKPGAPNGNVYVNLSLGKDVSDKNVATGTAVKGTTGVSIWRATSVLTTVAFDAPQANIVKPRGDTPKDTVYTLSVKDQYDAVMVPTDAATWTILGADDSLDDVGVRVASTGKTTAKVSVTKDAAIKNYTLTAKVGGKTVTQAIAVTNGTPVTEIKVLTNKKVTLTSNWIMDDAGNYFTVGNAAFGLPDSRDTFHLEKDTMVVRDPNSDAATKLEITGNNIQLPSGMTATFPAGTGKIEVDIASCIITLPAGAMVAPIDGTKTITLVNGATNATDTGDWAIILAPNAVIKTGTPEAAVTYPAAGGTITKEGKIDIAAGGTIQIGGTTVEVPNGKGPVTLKPAGEIELPANGQVSLATDGILLDAKAEKGSITVAADGKVTHIAGGSVTLKDGSVVTPVTGSATIDKSIGGVVTIPENATIVNSTKTVTVPAGQTGVTIGNAGDITVPAGGTVKTCNPETTVKVPAGSATVLNPDNTTGAVEVPVDTEITLSGTGNKKVIIQGSKATLNYDGTITVIAGGSVTIGDKVFTLPEGGTVNADGSITLAANAKVTLGGTTVTPPTGEAITVAADGTVTVPVNSTVQPGGGSGPLVTKTGNTTILKPDGSMVLTNGATVTAPGNKVIDVPAGSTVDNLGNITLPADGKVTLPGGTTVQPGAGGKVVILPDGTVKLPQGGTANDGKPNSKDVTVGAGGSVSVDGVVTQPSNPGGGGSGGGTVTPPAKSESVTITVKADGNGVATVDDAALKKALETAAKSGATTVIIDAGGKTIVLTQPQLKMLADNKNIQNVEFKTPLYRLRLDKSAQMSVAAETKGKISVSFSDGMNLDPETKVQQGKAPVAEVTLTSENGAVTKLGGTGTIFFNYTLKAGETADMLTGLCLPKNATAQRLPARYDAKMKMAEVDTTHMSVFSFTFDTMRFSDVKGWASDYIYHLANRGVVKGVTADMYMPEANVTRGEFVTLLARMSGAKLPAGTTEFMDVAADAWYAPSVAWAVSAGITKGTGEGYFNPDMPISRQDMAAMLARYTQHMGKQPDKTAETMTFADAATIAPYAVEAVTLMQQAGVINGRDGGNFAPMANATRGECAKMMSALLYAID